AVAQDADAVGRPLGEADALQRLLVDRLAFLERLVEVADVDDVEGAVPGGVAEAAFGDAAEQLHLPALEQRRRLLGAGAGPLTLAAARGRLAVAAADAAADALLALELVNAGVNAGQVHSMVTPLRKDEG